MKYGNYFWGHQEGYSLFFLGLITTLLPIIAASILIVETARKSGAVLSRLYVVSNTYRRRRLGGGIKVMGQAYLHSPF